MTIIKTIIREVIALFVDDGSLALAILAWLSAALLARALISHSSIWLGLVLASGLVLILVENALRRARK